MAIVGAASFDINANPAKAIAALKQLQKDALASTGLVLTPTVDPKGLKAKLKTALDGIVGIINAEVKIKPPTKAQATAALSGVVAMVQAEVKVKPPTATQIRAALAGITGELKVDLAFKPITQKALDAAFKTVPAEKVIKAKLDPAAALSGISALSTALSTLNTSFRGMFTVNVSALDALTRLLNTQITNLTSLETRLRALMGGGGGGGAGGGGAGGGSPGASTNPYAAQLRALQGDLKSSALGTDQYRTAVISLQAALNAEITSLKNLGVLSVQQEARLNGLRATSGQTAAALKGLADQQARTAAQSQQSGVAQLARDLAMANSKYEAGTLGLRAYLREIQQLKTSAATLAPGLTAGSKAAGDFARVMGGLNNAGANINTQSIKNVRLELAQARTAYEQALAAAGSSWKAQGQAASAYQQVLKGVDASLAGVARRANLTREQALSVANIQRQLASQQNALQGTVSPLGISGAFLNALRQVPGLAQAAGGSLGAAAGQAGMLGSGIAQAAQALGPLGLAIAAAIISIGALVLGLVGAVNAFADFQKGMQGVSAVSGENGAGLRALSQQALDLSEKYGVSANEIAKAQEEIFKSGRSTEDVLGGAAEAVVLLSKATGTDLMNAVTVANSAMNTFGLKGTDMARVADVITAGANKTALDVGTLGIALQQVGTSAATAGLSIEETTALLGMLADRGVAGSDAGTSLKTALQRLQAPTRKAAAELHDFGVEVYDSLGAQRNMIDIFGDVTKAMDHMTQQERAAFGHLVFGTDAIRTANTAFANGEKGLRGYIDKVNDVGGAQKNVETRTKGLRGEQEKLKTSFQSLRIGVGEIFEPAMTAMVKGLRSAVGAADDLIKALRGIPAFGAQSAGLQDWLTQTGLKEGDFSKTQLEQVNKLLKQRQDLLNSNALNKTMVGNLPLPGTAKDFLTNRTDTASNKQLGQNGILLAQLQALVSQGKTVQERLQQSSEAGAVSFGKLAASGIASSIRLASAAKLTDDQLKRQISTVKELQ